MFKFFKELYQKYNTFLKTNFSIIQQRLLKSSIYYNIILYFIWSLTNWSNYFYILLYLYLLVPMIYFIIIIGRIITYLFGFNHHWETCEIVFDNAFFIAHFLLVFFCVNIIMPLLPIIWSIIWWIIKLTFYVVICSIILIVIVWIGLKLEDPLEDFWLEKKYFFSKLMQKYKLFIKFDELKNLYYFIIYFFKRIKWFFFGFHLAYEYPDIFFVPVILFYTCAYIYIFVYVYFLKYYKVKSIAYTLMSILLFLGIFYLLKEFTNEQNTWVLTMLIIFLIVYYSMKQINFSQILNINILEKQKYSFILTILKKLRKIR